MKILSLFANIGVAEAYLNEVGFDVVLANELLPRRVKLYEAIYPQTKMICGNILDENVQTEILCNAKKLGVEVIIATPPCQGVSRAGKRLEIDVRNSLILPVLDLIDNLRPKYVMIENVPQFMDAEIEVDGDLVRLPEYIVSRVSKSYTIKTQIINTSDYSVPQTRLRTIFLLTRRRMPIWDFPPRDHSIITLKKAIGDLPSLDPFVSDISETELLKMFPDFYKKKKIAAKVSPWHRPPSHIKRQVETMIHTPTGKTAFDNQRYIPRKKDGSPVSGYKSTYRRLRWTSPASTVTMDNRKISSQNNVHPGTYIGVDNDGEVLYSDPRALTLLELMRVMSLPDDWALPYDVNEAFVRSVIGEGIPPLFIKKLFNMIKGK
jgi:DNA (cytosine-5)-methyltransferase 1